MHTRCRELRVFPPPTLCEVKCFVFFFRPVSSFKLRVMEFANQGVEAAKIAAQHEQKGRHAEAAYLYGVAASLVREAAAARTGVDAQLAADLPRYAAQYEDRARRCAEQAAAASARAPVALLDDPDAQQGLAAAQRAVDADRAGLAARAAEEYRTAARHLVLASAATHLAPADREAAAQKAAEYRARADTLAQEDARAQLAAQGPLRSPGAAVAPAPRVPFALRPGERYVDPAPRPGLTTRVANAVRGKSEFGGTGVAGAWL